MADPTKFDPSYNFSNYQASNPATPLPGSQVDIQFQALKTTTDETIEALKEIRRSDGALKNGIVTVDSFAADVLAGVQGVQGPQGETGPEGPQGAQGVQGPTGPTGPAGPQGIQGIQGIQGVQGVAGQSFTPDAIGPVGDQSLYDAELEGFAFLDATNGLLYFKLSDTSADWSVGAMFGRGPQGPQGVQGIQGPEGPEGPTGPTGPAVDVVAGQGIDVDATDPVAPIVSVDPSMGLIGGRLSLVSGDPSPEADVVGAASVYLVPAVNNVTSLYNGAKWVLFSFAQLTLTLVAAHQADNNYDVWEFDDAGALAIGTGPSWVDGAVAGSSYLRGTGAGSTELEMFEGRLVNKVAMTVRNGATTRVVAAREARLRGTLRMTANGVTEDSMAKRFVSNLHNPEIRTMVRADAADSWTYSAAAWRQANNSTLNRVQYVQCVAGRRTKCTVQGIAFNSTSTLRNVAVGIGINTATVNHATRLIGAVIGQSFGQCSARYDGYPGLGHRVLNWIEQGSGSDTQTWVGDYAQPDYFQTGIEAETLL